MVTTSDRAPSSIIKYVSKLVEISLSWEVVYEHCYR